MALSLELPGLDEQALPGLPGLRKKKRQDLTPEEERSLLGSIGHHTMSGLEKIGNVLDTDSAAVRNLLAGRNPLPGITDPNERISGRQLLEHYGILGPNQEGLDLGDVAGLATEILTDPKTYLTLGGSAFTKAGKALQAAGVGKNLTRTQRLGTTVRKALAGASPEQIESAARATEGLHGMRTGTAAQKIAAIPPHLLDEPLTRHARFHIPGLIDTTFNYPGGARVAKGIESLGETVYHGKLPFTNYSPGEHFAQGFNAAVKGFKSRRGQQIGRTATELEQAGRPEAIGFANEQLQKSLDAGFTSPADRERLRQIFEDPSLIKTPHEQELYDAVRRSLDQDLAEAQDLGAPAHELQDDVSKYFPRQLSSQIPPTSGGLGRARLEMTGKTPADIKRLDELKNIYGGSGIINKIGRDGDINKLIASNAPDETVAHAIEMKYGPNFFDVDQIPKFAKTLKTIPEEVRRAGIFVNEPYLDLQAHRLGRKRVNANLNAVYDALADKGVLQPQVLPATHVWQPGQLVRDKVRGNVGKIGAVSGNMASVDFVNPVTAHSATVNIPLQQLNLLGLHDPNTTSVEDLLKTLGVTSGDMNKGALKHIARRLGTPLNDAFLDMRVPRALADEITHTYQTFEMPDAVQRAVDLADSLTNATKAFQTSIRPAFHTRNRVSGIIHNMLLGMWSARADAEMRTVLSGGTVKGLGESVPLIRDMMISRGLNPADDKAATDMFRHLLAQYEVVGKFPGEITNVVGKAAASAPRTTEEMLSEFAGGLGGSRPARLLRGTPSHPSAFGKLIGRGQPGVPLREKLKPWAIRGVGGRTESTFAPFKAAEDVGAIVEGMNRGSPFLTLLRRGVDPLVAAQKVGAAQALYAARHFTPLEREVMTRLFPFYKFSKNLAPFVAAELAQHPGGPIAQSIRASRTGRDQDTLVPEQVAQGASIPLASNFLTGDVPQGVKRYIGQLGLMHEDPLQFAAGPKDAALEVASRLNPMAKGLIEYLTGESLFQRGPRGGRPLEDLDPVIGRTIANVLDLPEPVHYPGERFIEAMLPNVPGGNLASLARTATDPRKDIRAKAINLLSGIKLTDVSPATQRAILRDRAMETIRSKPGSRVFSEIYLKPEELAQLSPMEQEEVLRAKAAMNVLDAQARREKKARENAPVR
jgi:hypothetical protein